MRERSATHSLVRRDEGITPETGNERESHEQHCRKCRTLTEMGGRKKKKEIKPTGPPLMKPPSDSISSSDASTR